MNRSGLLFRCRVLRPQIQRNVKKSLIWRQKGEDLSFLLGDTILIKVLRTWLTPSLVKEGVTLAVPYEKNERQFLRSVE